MRYTHITSDYLQKSMDGFRLGLIEFDQNMDSNHILTMRREQKEKYVQYMEIK